MNIYEDEQYEIKMDRITDRMGYLILDLISMAIEKLDHENQIYEEFLQVRLETKNDQSLNKDILNTSFSYLQFCRRIGQRWEATRAPAKDRGRGGDCKLQPPSCLWSLFLGPLSSDNYSCSLATIISEVGDNYF